MTDRPYTDEDLRAEAARQLNNATEDPDFGGIAEQMEGHKIPSRGDFQWDQLSEDDFDTAKRKIDDLLSDAVDVSAWAVSLGADGLKPIDGSLNIKDSHGDDRVRLHLAFAPDMDEDTRKAVIDRIADAIRYHS